MLKLLALYFSLIAVIDCDIHLPFFLNADICFTTECKHLGYQIYSSLNTSVNPCDNLYEFTCGNWIANVKKPNSEPLWNHHLHVDSKINNRIQNILEDDDQIGENSAFKKAVNFYKYCNLNDKKSGDKNLENLKNLLTEFKGFLSKNGVFNKTAILYEIARITKRLNIHPIIKMSVNIDYKNTSIYSVYIEPGNLIFPVHILLNPQRYPVEINAYKLWIYESFEHVYTKESITKQEIMKILEFEIKLAKMMRRTKMERTSTRVLSYKLKVDITGTLNYLLGRKDRSVKNEDIVIIKNVYYLKNLFMLLRRTKTTTIENYLLWTIIKELSRETNNYMRNLNFIVDRTVLGVKSDLSRKAECVNRVKDYFGYAILPKYVDKYFNDNTVEVVKEMIQNIKIEFIGLLSRNKWLSEGTKFLAMEKVKYIRDFVGYPRHLRDENIIEHHYREFNITNDHFKNVVNIKKILAQMEFSKFNHTVGGILWPSNVFEVNAYYSILQNTIFIPLGLLEPPFYYKNAPNFINYGSLGSLIGHELSHSLDSTGRQANKEGIVSKWWPQKDISEYQLNARCIINQYNNYNINGLITVGENIADNIGLTISYNAYRKQKQKFTLVPYMETYTNKQLFFISFAQMWCEISNREDLFNEEHSSVRNRVLGTIFNSKYFEDDFDCTKDFTKNKCSLW